MIGIAVQMLLGPDREIESLEWEGSTTVKLLQQLENLWV